MKFEGRCWKFGDFIPTDAITPIHVIFKPFPEMARHVLEGLNPEFPRRVAKNDILVAGKHFACSSGRAVAPKALQATGIGAIVAESFSRTFYRNAFEIGLPILECPGITDKVEDGDRLEVDIEQGTVTNKTSGEVIRSRQPSPFLLEMLKAGGLIPFLEKTGELT